MFRYGCATSHRRRVQLSDMRSVDSVSEDELLDGLTVVIFVHVARWILDCFCRLLIQDWVLELFQFHPVLVLLA